MIWLPIFITGLSDVIGSWKTIAICVPQRLAQLVVGRVDDLVALEQDAAGPLDVLFGSRPMIERDSTDLPEPDSPTTPSVLPRSSEKRDAVDRAHQAARRS